MLRRSVPRSLQPADGSRSTSMAWPADPAAILAAYPDDDAIRVRIMGGAEAPAAVLGRESRIACSPESRSGKSPS